jgi:predicted nucleic acid-binding protein
MAGAYLLDSSAAAKRYIVERGSAWVTALTDPSSGNQCWLAAITRAKILAAFQLRVRTGTLTPAQARQAEQLFRTELHTHFRPAAISDAIFDRAMRLVAAHPLRAYDAVQLAAALAVQVRYSGSAAGFVFVCADQVLNRAALAEGLFVDDPNNHP